MKAPQLCRLVDREYSWLATRLRLARAHLAAGRHVDAAQTLPLSSYEPHASHDAGDVLRMAVAVEGERLGLSFEAAAALATSIDLSHVLTASPADRTTWAWAIRDGSSTRYGTGRMADYLASYGAGAANAVMIDLSHLWSRLRLRAAELRIDLAPSPRTVRAPRQLSPLNIRPPQATL